MNQEEHKTHLESGWMARQMGFAAEETKKWPDWMKKEAGIHQRTQEEIDVYLDEKISLYVQGYNIPEAVKSLGGTTDEHAVEYPSYMPDGISNAKIARRYHGKTYASKIPRRNIEKLLMTSDVHAIFTIPKQ